MRLASLAHLAVVLTVTSVLGCDDTNPTSSAGGSTSASTSTSVTGTTSGTTSSVASSTGAGMVTTDFTAGGDRPTTVFVPPNYDATKPAPLLILLHGYTASGAIQEAYLKVKAVAQAHGMIYAHPDGTKEDSTAKNQFWNATDACCNFYGSTVDDSKYLIDLVNEIKTRVNVDPKRVYFFGHSNGGFMSHRMACDHAGDIAAIASLAGAMYDDPSNCKPSEPVAVLQIHGTADETIAYAGGTTVTTYPGAVETITDWATLDGCAPTPDTSKPNLDLEGSLMGDETKVTAFNGCKAGGAAELWTIEGGSHVPSISATFTETVVQFLLDHPKP
ncbi:MAG: PHB depolymerase family esterase [Polyangiaceae bacterium]